MNLIVLFLATFHVNYLNNSESMNLIRYIAIKHDRKTIQPWYAEFNRDSDEFVKVAQNHFLLKKMVMLCVN